MILGPDDDVTSALGRPPRRLVVAGASGAGKSTLCGRIAGVTGVPYTELDSLHWGPDWTPRPDFVSDVTALVDQEAFVIEWQYRRVRPLLLERAEVLVWLDLPARTQMRQVVARTWRRARTGEELWNGNRERSLWRAVVEQEGIIRWAWQTRHKLRDLPERVEREAPHLVLARLRSWAEADRWLTSLTG